VCRFGETVGVSIPIVHPTGVRRFNRLASIENTARVLLVVLDMSDPQPGIHRPTDPLTEQLRKLYARHFAVVQRLEARRLAAANRRFGAATATATATGR
jgi:hypothetical protein